MYLLLTITLLLVTGSEARPVDGGGQKVCRMGNTTLPIRIFESYAGWECFEESYGSDRGLTVVVCSTEYDGLNYSVPCFKAGSKVMSFDLKREETILEILNRFKSVELNHEMIRCYLNLMNRCEANLDGWLQSDSSECRSYLVYQTNSSNLEGQSKFHISMLSISLIVGIPIAFIHILFAIISSSVSMFHCGSILIVLVFRTLFTLLIETEIVSKIIKSSEEPFVSWSGCEALIAFEAISLNMVVSLWLVLALYLFESSKTNFEKCPSIRRSICSVIGFSLILSFVWIIIMVAGKYDDCWLTRTPLQWLNDSYRLISILVQIVLLSYTVYQSLTDILHFEKCVLRFHLLLRLRIRLQRKLSIISLGLSIMSLIHFSLVVSHPTTPLGPQTDAHIYTEFFFDGLQCAIVSILFSYVYVNEIMSFWGPVFDKKRNRMFQTSEPGSNMTVNGARQNPCPAEPTETEEDTKRDITYTSVLSPERFERTIKLYNRLNVIPRQEVMDEHHDNSSIKSEYFEVDNDSGNTVYIDVTPTTEDKDNNNNHVYYTSRYLVQDSDEEGRSSSASSVEIQEKQKKALQPSWHLLNSFHEYAEKEVNVKRLNQRTLYRSWSGGEVNPKEIPGRVRVNLKAEPTQDNNKSAPSLLNNANERVFVVHSFHAKELPEIYGDLRQIPKEPKLRIKNHYGKNDYGKDWSSYRNRLIQQRKRIKSLDAVEEKEKEKETLTPQLDALLSPSYQPRYPPQGNLQSQRGKFHTGPFIPETKDDGAN